MFLRDESVARRPRTPDPCPFGGSALAAMQLRVQGLWSPDLSLPSEGEVRPDDLGDFHVFMQVALEEVGKDGAEVFGFFVASPSALSRAEVGSFISHTLVLESFSWAAVRARLEKLLMHTHSATTWPEVTERLSGILFASDA